MIYLFYGPDEFARSEALLTLRSAFPPDLAELNISQLDGRRLKIDALAAACEAMPFLAERRLVIVRDALKHTKAGKDREDLRAYLAQVPSGCDLVFVESDDLDRRSILFTYLKQAAELREFTRREGTALLRWLDERARSLDVRLPGPAAQRIVELVGSDSRMLMSELSKLANYVGRGGLIAPEHVDLLVQDNQEQNLFAFIDELSARRLGSALRGARSLLEDGQAPPYILFMLARQVRVLLGVRELAAQRMRPDAIAAELGQRPFVVRKAVDQCRNFGPGELEHLHDRLLELDLALKTGRIQADTALELFVAEACAR